MKIKTEFISFRTNGNCDIVDITNEIERVISGSGITEGNVLIFAVGSTAAITTIEYEPGLLKDYPSFFEKIIPTKMSYHHDSTWHDGNGHSHVRAALQGPSLTVPFIEKKLLTGTWQQIVFIDFDNRSRNRKVVVQVMGI